MPTASYLLLARPWEAGKPSAFHLLVQMVQAPAGLQQVAPHIGLRQSLPPLDVRPAKEQVHRRWSKSASQVGSCSKNASLVRPHS